MVDIVARRRWAGRSRPKPGTARDQSHRNPTGFALRMLLLASGLLALTGLTAKG